LYPLATPPVPSLVVPSNGLSMGCKASQSLTWLPVDDPSGVAEYQVNIQKSGDNSNWNSLSGASLTEVDLNNFSY